MLTNQLSNNELKLEFEKVKIPSSPRNIIIKNKKNLFKIILNKINRKIKYIIFKNNIYRKILKVKYPINTPGEIIWVNPNFINHIIFNCNYENTLTQLSSVEAGKWDKNIFDIKDLNIYQGLFEFIINNQPLNKTKFYNPNIKNQSDFKNEGVCRSWEYISEYEYGSRSKKIESLVNSIKKDGYKTQTQLGGIPNDEIIVKIDRHGKILFFNGIHRFCIAKILSLEKIPVIVKTRHIEWYKFKNELFSYANKQQLGANHERQLYQKLSHPDLQDIPYTHENDDRFVAIEKNRISKGGTLLDIGANFGFFCSKLEELGYNCTAVESNPELVYFMEKIKKAEQKSFRIINDNILDSFNKPTKFDVVLALNIFHHFIKTESNYNKFINLLRNLTIKEMFFEPHNPDEFMHINPYKNLNNEQFIEIIMKNTNLNNCKNILNCYENRKLYHLWNE